MKTTTTLCIMMTLVFLAVSCNSQRRTEAIQIAAAGSAAMQKGEWENALQQFERASALRPSAAEYHTGVGMAAAKLGRDDLAATQYDMAAQILAQQALTGPDRVDDFALMLDLLGRHGDSIAAIKAGAARFPGAQRLQELAKRTNVFEEMVSEYGIKETEPARGAVR